MLDDISKKLSELVLQVVNINRQINNLYEENKLLRAELAILRNQVTQLERSKEPRVYGKGHGYE